MDTGSLTVGTRGENVLTTVGKAGEVEYLGNLEPAAGAMDAGATGACIDPGGGIGFTNGAPIDASFVDSAWATVVKIGAFTDMTEWIFEHKVRKLAQKWVQSIRSAHGIAVSTSDDSHTRFRQRNTSICGEKQRPFAIQCRKLKRRGPHRPA